MVQYSFHSYTTKLPEHLSKIVDVFQKSDNHFPGDDSDVRIRSNEVLSIVRSDLESLGF